ncbi:hypothetical protein N7468_001005 [Penicillium chermesinum]|uniref:Uncharacterized protein n=1 Tax=Penicillium chermesinum TaxID=63820 RepID=A0A9W9TWL7_9EURO|nr:uncharacterized protein N7468_001005 [Penicillium chermesinum]KAJ5246022.1 hypothetical protein N7468_001005 [Penicillium chermesinum]
MTTFSVTSQVPFLLLLPLLQIVPVFASTEVHVERSANSDEHRPVDKSLLAVQVGSIAGSYVIFTAVLLALLLFVGRRLRRTVHSSNYSLQMQMLKPLTGSMIMDPSPISPTAQTLPSPSQSNKFQSWGSLPRAGRPSQTSFNDSMVTVDEGVLANDRQRAQDEMEMLYAAVMEQDAQKAAGLNISSVRDSESQSPDSQYTSPFSERTASQISVAPPPVPPKSPRPSAGSRLSKLFSSRSSTHSDGGKLKSPKQPVRKLGISSPMASPDMNASHSYGENQAPMSPRFYTPGPPTISSYPSSLNAAAQPLNKLPFRDAYPLQSAPATKTTILERPQNRNGPITGMPTPYSPYMPFTPVTPFTPGRTVTRKQRKREEKEAGLHVLNEDDLVKDDQDIWG